MKRTRAQQPKAEDTQDPTTAANPAKPQRRAKEPRQPKAAGGAAKKPGAATARAAAVAAAAATNAASAAVASPGPEMAPTVPDACAAAARQEGEEEAEARPVECCWDLDGGLDAAAWWTWGVDEEKLLGWFPFVEEDFRCAGGRAGDAEVAAFDHDIWSIW
ncbi:unnamed protein product [Urochloa humidicola]